MSEFRIPNPDVRGAGQPRKETKTMKKTKTRNEPKTPTEPKADPAHDLAISRLSRIIDQAEHQAALHERDARIAKLTEQVNEHEDRICELRSMVRSLGGVIASV